jgi:threonine dehydrogenase-like Zn-dependent dehydrogenase
MYVSTDKASGILDRKVGATNLETVQKLVDFVSGKSTYATSTHVQPMWDEIKTMKCLVWNGKNDIEYVEHARPKITEPKDILLQVTATTICGSDLHLLKGNISGMKKGDIPGHEFMGIIKECGSDVQKLRVGDRVIVSSAIACGECSYCKREEYTACETTNPTCAMEVLYGHKLAAFYGYSHLTGGVPGGQADFVRVPFADFNCMIVPDDVPDEKALYMTDILVTGLHGNNCAEVKEGKTVAVWGLSPIGLMTAKWATILGAKMVIGIDCIPERLDLAKDKLQIETINFKQEDVLKRIHEILGANELDCAIECAGFDYSHSWLHKLETLVGHETDTSEIINQMFKAVRKYGNVALIGNYLGYANHFPIGAMMEKNLTIKSGQTPGKRYWKFCLEKIQSGEMDPTFLVTHRGTLADGPNYYRNMCDLKAGVIKVFMRPENYEP